MFLTSLNYKLAGLATSLHHSLHRLSNESEIVPDLYIYNANKTYMIDVSIVYPAGSTYVNINHADTKSLAAAKQRGEEKIKKYDLLA